MNAKLSTSLASDILHRTASGQPATEISQDLNIAEAVIADFLSQVQLELLPNKRPSPNKHQLTDEDRRKGGKASQLSREQQRDDYANRIVGLIDTKIKAVELATAHYWFRPGSGKEFSITIPNTDTGLLFYRALRSIGTPDESITFNWRCLSADDEKNMLRQQWGELGPKIRFSKSGTSKTLRLTTGPFNAADEKGDFKVSSRGLAQAFLKIGNQVIVYAAQR